MVWAGGAVKLVSGRWTKWIVIAVWLVLFMGLGGLAGRLNDAQQNDTAQWLPSDAESTQVVELQRTFQSTDVFPAVIVYQRTSGTTAADQDKVRADATALAGVDGVAGEVLGPVPADDGQALRLIVPVAMDEEGQRRVVDRVGEMREIVTTGGNGLSVHVTGPIGFAADTTQAFEGIDTTLLFAAVAVVIVLLLLTYRSPVLWLLPVLSAGVALICAQAVVYLLAEHADLTVTGQSAAILLVLVFGASTDYALLLISRYREALRQHADRHAAMAVALRRAGPAIIASAATVTIGMLCLMFAVMNSTSGLGPVVAVGIVVGLLAMLTLLPALLVVFGRWLFWPARPKQGSADPSGSGAWARLGQRIARRPRAAWVVTALVLGAMALGLTQLEARGLPFEDSFVSEPSSVEGAEVLAAHFPAGQGQPVVVIGDAAAQTQLRGALSGTDGIAEVTDPVVSDGLVLLEGTLQAQPGSPAADATIRAVRESVHAVGGADARVGGLTAMTLDMNDANSRDNRLIIPLVLLVVLLILGLLLRAVVAPLLLVATVVLSFGAALGVSALVFVHVLGFEGADSSFPLFVFVFLVALGIDYNIFLVTRIREEARRHGTRRGALIGLATTGGVITSAGLVLAGTFAVLGTLPVVFLAQLGFAVALGVLLDTFVVRSILVTALSLDLGRWLWWPSKLAAVRDTPAAEPVDRPKEPELAS